jgi:hypothetical protein
VVAGALLVAALAAVGCTGTGRTAGGTTTTAATTTTLVPPGLLAPIDQVLPGQCFDQLPDQGQRPFAVLAIPCERRHHFEIFHRFTYRDGNGRAVPKGYAYPGETTVRTAAEQGCFAEFAGWIGTSWTRSDYDIESWWPTADSWTKHDRTITCAAYRFDGKPTTGSVRGTGR